MSAALQAIVLGESPAAMIDGRLYRVGGSIIDPSTWEEIEGLRLIEVASDGATLAHEPTGEQVWLPLE